MITNLRQLDLNLLLVFDALMQEGNLTRAAQRLHLSQSTVSNALARLRHQLGEELFQRTARGMTPTARALALYPPVRQALQMLQAGLGPAEPFDARAPHVFSLSLNDYAQAALLPEHHRAVAAGAASAALPPADDPLGRLIAAGVLLRRTQASPAVVEQAVETASHQGWRRPLLAWLGVQARLAEQRGDAAEAARVRRRMDLVQPLTSPATP